MAAFFSGVKQEFRKILWPNKNMLVKETIAVVLVSLFLGLLIALLDWIFQWGLGFIL